MLNIIKKEKWKIDSLNFSTHFSFSCPCLNCIVRDLL